MKWSRYLRLSVASLALAVIAAAAIPAAADTIVQSFHASTSIKPGWIVALADNSTDTVKLAPADQPNHIYGVTIDPSQAPATLQRQSNQQLFVATSGIYPVLASMQNGAIKPGDYLSISSTDGVAAKATGNQDFILGRSAQSFNGTSGVLASAGGFAVGKVSVTILLQQNPLLKGNVIAPSLIKKIGNSVAGKEISSIRVYAGLAVFIIAAAMCLGILITGIRSSMISIGRNPLSKPSILRGLAQVVITATLVLILGVTSVYLLLRL